MGLAIEMNLGGRTSYISLGCLVVLGAVIAQATLAQGYVTDKEHREPNGDDVSLSSIITALSGQRLLWQVVRGGATSASASWREPQNPACTNTYVFNRTTGAIIWRHEGDADEAWSTVLGSRHAYSVARQGVLLRATSLTNGKTKWTFPPRSWLPWVRPLGLPHGAGLRLPLEATAPAANADADDDKLGSGNDGGGGGGGGGSAESLYGSGLRAPSGTTGPARLSQQRALATVAAASQPHGRSSNTLTARIAVPSAAAATGATGGTGDSAAAPEPGAPAAGPAPAAAGGGPPPWLVLVASRRPGNRLYGVWEDSGRLAWELHVSKDGDDGAETTDLALVPQHPGTAFVSSRTVNVADGGVAGFLDAVNASQGTVRWSTGPLPAGAPTIALGTADYMILRGAPDADLTQTLYCLNARTGAMLWIKACATGCAVLLSDERTAIVMSYSFTVSEVEAVDLASGKVIWRGVDSSTDAGSSCSGAIVEHKRLYFGCPCGDEGKGAGGGEPGEGGDGRVNSDRDHDHDHDHDHYHDGGEGGGGGGGDGGPEGTSEHGSWGGSGDAVQAAASAELLHQRQEQQGSRGGLAKGKGEQLCAFAVSAETGEPVWKTPLHDNSSFPAGGGGDSGAGRGRGGLLPLLAGETLVLATQAAVHGVDRGSGKRVWAFELPPGEEVKSWDLVDQRDGLVVVRSAATPPLDSRLYGINGSTGALQVNVSLPPSYGPPATGTAQDAVRASAVQLQQERFELQQQGTAGAGFGVGADAAEEGGGPGLGAARLHGSLPYDVRDGVAYVDACSGQRCCLVAVDLQQGKQQGQQQLIHEAQRQMRRRLLADGELGLLLWTASAASAAAGRSNRLRDDGDAPAAGGGGGGGGGNGTAPGRSFTFCVDVGQACRAGAARSLGLYIIYLLLAAQLGFVVAGFGSVVVWRLCCRRRYVPYTRLNALPVLEVYEHDVGSEEPDDEEEVRERVAAAVGAAGGQGAGGEAAGEGRQRGVVMMVDEESGVAVPVVEVEVGRDGKAG